MPYISRLPRSIHLRRFYGQDTASITVEFGLLCIPVIGVILLSIYIALYFTAEEALIHVVDAEARLIMTGEQATLDEWRRKNQPWKSLSVAFREDAQKLMPALASAGQFSIRVDSASTWQDLKVDPSGSGYEPGKANQYVMVSASYKFPLLSNTIASFERVFFGTNLSEEVNVRAIVKAEPY